MLNDLSVDFAPYQKTSAEYMLYPTDRNMKAMLDDLDDVLKDIKKIYDLLWQGASISEGRAALVRFAESLAR